jgi:hypothetical protein
MAAGAQRRFVRAGLILAALSGVPPPTATAGTAPEVAPFVPSISIQPEAAEPADSASAWPRPGSRPRSPARDPTGLPRRRAFPPRSPCTRAATAAPTAWGRALCRARYVIGTSPQGVREVAIDCNAAPGASGAALLDAQHRAWAIYVGYRSANPDRAQPFSRTHYNFAITIEGAFRRAVHAAGGR